MSFTQEESRSLGNDHIGGEHFLLGLLCEQDGLAARVLASLGRTLDNARTQTVTALLAELGSSADQIRAKMLAMLSGSA